ncbi:hypothetical protein GOB93_08880 [Acetobacter musti]|uniref:Uncharacterized protein n=1 Tax=Acetobacter musti TaxID=864732 RepID=A0ABX0JQJ5_9PROT|nr:hypothetical protein [Acetobacter musti]NHN84756.1 hypothetical protein [Acetobacter musti]
MSDTVNEPKLTSSDLANNQRATEYYNEHGCDTVGTAFTLADILHTDRCVAEAARLYKTAYTLHSGQPEDMPGAHVLLLLSLLCALKAGQTPDQDDLDRLRSLSIPFYNYILGIQTAWSQADFVKAARIMGNCYEEFHTGEECDRLYLEVMNRVYHDQMQSNIADIRSPDALIPRRLYMYRPQGSADDIEGNVEFHNSLAGLEFRLFSHEEAADWLYNVYGVDSRTLFLTARNEAEAADFFRVHVIQKLGGWWLDANCRIRSEDAFFNRLSQLHSHVFLLNRNNSVHTDFFGATPGSSVLGDALLSLYRNSWRHPDLPIRCKTGPGIFERALNRMFHADFERIRAMPSLITYDETAFTEVIGPAS